MTTLIHVLIGALVGFAYGAIVIGLAYRREIEQRDAWEEEARELLRATARGEVSRPVRESARRLLSDEAGA